MRPGAPDTSLKMRRIKAILLDVDGVLTDGRIVLGPQGAEFKFFDVRDGHRLRMAKRAGLRVFFVTGRRSEAVARRGEELGVDGVYQGVTDKMNVLDEIARAACASQEELAYMGDDLVDLPIMNAVGLSACPSDAVPEVRARAALVTEKPGGRGAVGELVEELLRAQGKWETLASRYTDHG